MKLTAFREIFREETTIGHFLINGDFQCFTLEDKVRGDDEPRIPGKTAIPEGTYNVTLRTEGTTHEAYLKRFGSDFHKGTLWIRGVWGDADILIHIGDFPEDTRGCLLIGDVYTPEAPDRISQSEAAYRRIYPIILDVLLRGEAVTIEVVNDR